MCYLVLYGPCYLFPKKICYLFLLSGREWLFASRNMTVSSRVWLSENDFRRVLVDGSLFH